MKVSSSLLLIACFAIFLSSCQAAWYRQLPSGEVNFTRNYIGKWKKKSNQNSAINSSWHKNQWSEEIHFQSQENFTKTYESKDYIGDTLAYEKMEGSGKYLVHGNWLLLKTGNIDLIIIKDEKLIKKESSIYDSSLLYYYYQDENLIIPMIYDMGYKEMDFGVKDGVDVPYDENELNFFRYIRIYAFKEFQSHAYYPEK